MDQSSPPYYPYAYQNKLAKLNFYLLLGLAATLFFDQGRYKLLNYLLELVTLTLVISACLGKQNCTLKKQVFAGFLIISALLFSQLMSGETEWPKREVKNFIFMLCAIAAVTLLPDFRDPKEIKLKIHAILILIAIATISYVYFILAGQNPYGAFKNPHFLSLEIVILANIAAFFCLRYSGYRRAIGAATLVVSVFTLTLITSRIAWVALGMSTLVWLFLLFQNVKYIKLSILSVLIIGLFSSTLVNYTGESVKELATENNAQILELWRDERVIVWTDALKMQKDSSTKQWFVGHGLGSFKEAFDKYSSYGEQGQRENKVTFTFPHNFFLEILHTTGLLGILALLLPLGYIIIRVYKATARRNLNAMLALALLTGVFIHTFFTLPLFSSYTSTSLGLIIGYCLWLDKRAKIQHD